MYGEFSEQDHVTDANPPNPEDYPDNHIIMAIDFGFQPSVHFSYVDQGQPIFFKEIVIDDINFYELLRDEIIPYLEKALPYYYENQQIQVVGDPTSGSRRSAIKSATPIGVLLGDTDINGDEHGDAERYKFDNVHPSPCGNSFEYRLDITKQILSKHNGVKFDRKMTYTLQMFDELVMGPGGTKPKKKAGNLLHGPADTFQYTIAYIRSGLPTHVEEKITRKKKRRTSNKKRYY